MGRDAPTSALNDSTSGRTSIKSHNNAPKRLWPTGGLIRRGGNSVVAGMIQVLIQVEAGSCDKHFYNERTLEYRETRRITRPYPYPYGFTIGTSAADGDCVDCYLITHAATRAEATRNQVGDLGGGIIGFL